MKFNNNLKAPFKPIIIVLLVSMLAGCFGSNSTSSSSSSNTDTGSNNNNTTTETPSTNYDTSTSISTAAAPTVKISGTISGLGGTIVLQNNLGDDLTLIRNGSFTFAKRYYSSASNAYSITIKQQPGGQACSLSNANGATSTSISNISVTCSGTASTLPNVNIARIEVAQIFSQTSQSTYQRLIPGRRTLVRAFVYAIAGSVGATTPAVTVTATSGGVLQGIAAMTCPSVLAQTPTTIATSYARADTCYVELDGKWINPNLTLKVSAGNTDLSITPDVITVPRKLDLVIVPIVVNNQTPSVPTLLTIKQTIYKKLPFPYDQIGVTVRAAYRPTSTATALGTKWWEDVIDEINSLRITEDPNTTKFYYGMLPYSTINGGYLGLGYVNTTDAQYEFSPTSIGYNGDNNNDWARILIHELSHNLSNQHAPCGRGDVRITGIDPNYPGWTSGYAESSNFTKLGTTPIYEQIADTMFNPSASSHVDIMGYCEGQWLSEYNLHLQTTFLRTNGIAKLMASALAYMQNANPTPQLRLSGRIYSDKVLLRAIDEHSGVNSSRSSKNAKHLLRLHLKDNTKLEYPISTVKLGDDVDGSVYFSFTVDKPTAVIDAIEITDMYGEKLPVMLASDPTKRLDIVSEQTEQNARLLAVEVEKDSRVTISEQTATTLIIWDNQSYPWLKATLVKANGEREVLALRATGGQLNLNKINTQGGYWEIVLSDGINTSLQKVSR